MRGERREVRGVAGVDLIALHRLRRTATSPRRYRRKRSNIVVCCASVVE
jgi:hypothetical protein